MRLTPALYVRQLLAKLHPPLPPSARESQKLLNLLETSFRRHLDEVHPAPQTPIATNSPHGLSTVPDPAHATINATNSHWESILQHPLLRQRGEPHPRQGGLTTAAVDGFDQALLSKTLDGALVRTYARRYRHGLKNGESVSGESKLGVRIAAWLASAEATQKKAFLTNVPVMTDVLHVLYSDGLEHIVWEWLRILYERDFGPVSKVRRQELDLQSPDMLQAEDNFVSLMMRASIQRGSLNDAAQQFAQACEYRAQSGRAFVEFSDEKDGLLYQPMFQSWRRLSASVLYRRGKHAVSAPLFDTMLKYSIPFSWAPSVPKAFLMIYHPTKPSAKLLDSKTRTASFVEPFLSWQNNLSGTFKRALLMAVLDAAQLSLVQNHQARARRFLEFAEAHYPESISTKNETNTAARLESSRQEVLEGFVPLHFAVA